MWSASVVGGGLRPTASSLAAGPGIEGDFHRVKVEGSLRRYWRSLISLAGSVRLRWFSEVTLVKTVRKPSALFYTSLPNEVPVSDLSNRTMHTDLFTGP